MTPAQMVARIVELVTSRDVGGYDQAVAELTAWHAWHTLPPAPPTPYHRHTWATDGPDAMQCTGCGARLEFT